MSGGQPKRKANRGRVLLAGISGASCGRPSILAVRRCDQRWLGLSEQVARVDFGPGYAAAGIGNSVLK